jgi:hypothetical protein
MYVHCPCGYPLLVAASSTGSDDRHVLHESASGCAPTGSGPPVTTCPQCGRKVLVMRVVDVAQQQHSSRGQRQDVGPDPYSYPDLGESQDQSQEIDMDIDLDAVYIHQPLRRSFFDERQERRHALGAAMGARNVVMSNVTWARLLQSLEVYAQSNTLLMDVADVKARIRVSQPSSLSSQHEDHVQAQDQPAWI